MDALNKSWYDRAQRARASRDSGEFLRITGEARHAGLDVRLVHPTAPDRPDSKVNVAVRRIYDTWKAHTKHSGVQLVFSDIAVNQSKALPGQKISIYEDMKKKLIDSGIPAEQVGFIGDADSDSKKETLFKAVREGRVRVLFGSTQKMGAGTNVQDRLVALWNLDIPWRPRDFEQRLGRILRRGNKLLEIGAIPGVEVGYFTTEGSFDAFMMSRVASKAAFIEQGLSGDPNVWEAEDIGGDSQSFSFAEIAAVTTGNPMILEKAKLEQEVAKLARLERGHKDDIARTARDIGQIPNEITALERRLEAKEKDLAARQDTHGEKFVLKLHGKEYTKRPEAGVALHELLVEAIKQQGEENFVGQFAGFDLFLGTTGLASHKALST